jgi:hypothetical protein
MGQMFLTCDGCGQEATSEHIAKRLKRLELSTRFRPIRIQTVYLGAAPSASDHDFLYGALEGGFHGEGAALLQNLGFSREGKTAEAVLAEFQRNGNFLTHVLECPFEEGIDEAAKEGLLRRRLPVALLRIKRSLRPKQVQLISSALDPFAEALRQATEVVEQRELA